MWNRTTPRTRFRPRNTRRVLTGGMCLERLEGRQLLSAAEFELSSLLPANGGDGSTGSVVTGVAQNGFLGRFPTATQPLGDINQDGYADVLLSAFRASSSDPSSAGHVYILLGRPGGFPVQPDLNSLDGVSGYTVEGVSGQGLVGAAVGDVNHDGAPDVALLVPAARSSTGLFLDGSRTYVLFGGGGHLASLDLADGFQDGHINVAAVGGADGFVINGTPTDPTFSGTTGNTVSSRVANAGDLNGDHVDDLVIGSAHAPADPGRVYVIFGRDSSAGRTFPATIDLGALDGSNGFLIPGKGPVDDLGASVTGAGDVNADGFGDLVLGAEFATTAGGTQSGRAYVVFGRASFPATFDLGTLNGTNGFAVNGGAPFDYLGGWSGGGPGDFNGDGVSDVLIQAFGADGVAGGPTGASYVIFGKKTAVAGPFAAAIGVGSLVGSNGVALLGTRTYSAFAGDVNHDGYDDVITADYTADPNNLTDAGRAFVVYGGSSFGPSLSVTSLLAANGGDGSAGFALNGYAAGGYAGFGIGGAGDLNGDGYADILVAASYADANGLTDNGQAYLVYGKPSPAKATKFYVVGDSSPDRTFEYTATGSAVESYAVGGGNTAPRGAASTAAGDKVWVVDANKNVYVYNTVGTLLGSWTAGGLPPNAAVEGITTNGTDVWVVDAQQDKVFRYTGAAGRLSGTQNAAGGFTLNSGNAGPKDVVTDGTSLWVVNDSITDKVFKYSLSGSLLGSWTITGAGSSPTGITLDPSGGGTLWTVDGGTGRVYQFDNARGRTSGSLAPSTGFPLAAGNANPQGIADPPTLATGAARAAGRADLRRPPAGWAAYPSTTIPGFREIRSNRETPAAPAFAAIPQPSPQAFWGDRDLTLIALEQFHGDARRTRFSVRSVRN